MKDILEAHIEEIHENTDSLILALLKAIVEDDNINRNRVDNCANTYLTGEILDSELPGRTKLVNAFTVHSFQGTTIPIHKKCFVDISSLKAVEDVYTAISRVRTIQQLYLI
jgi:hypothetical protein